MQIKGCVQGDRNRLYKMAASVIAWKAFNSNLSTESKAAPVYICPLNGLSMVYSNRTTIYRVKGPILTVSLTQISGKIHIELTRSLAGLSLHNEVSQSK